MSIQVKRSNGCPTEFAKIGPATGLLHTRRCVESRWASCGVTGTGAFDLAVFGSPTVFRHLATAYQTTVAALNRNNGNLATLRPGMILVVQPSR